MELTQIEMSGHVVFGQIRDGGNRIYAPRPDLRIDDDIESA